MPVAPGMGTLNEIMEAMVSLEQTHLPTLFPTFHAFKRVPNQDEDDIPYPWSFRFPPEAETDWRHMGSGATQPLSYTIEVAVVIGLAADPLGDLTAEAEKYILAFLGLYYANSRIRGTIHKIEFGRVRMGDLIVNGVRHFGPVFPIITMQQMRFPAFPTMGPLP